MTLRIAFLVNGFPDGSETFIRGQAEGLVRDGHRVDMYLGNTPRSAAAVGRVQAAAAAMGVRVHHAPPGGWQRLRAAAGGALRLSRLLALGPRDAGLRDLLGGRRVHSLKLAVTVAGTDGDYDAIVAHYGQNGIRGELLRRAGLLHGRLFTAFHGYDIAKPGDDGKAGLYRSLFTAPDSWLLPVSAHWAQRLTAWGADPARVVVHRMGVDCERFRFVARRDCTGPRLVSVGRLVEKKGFEYAIRAVARLGPMLPGLRYDIVGDGPLAERLQTLAEAIGAGAWVRFRGWRSNSEVAETLARADALLAPSVTAANGDQEGIPVSLMEAMASGVPVISTSHSGIPELVRNGETGLLAAEGDVDGLVACVLRLMDEPGLSARLAHNGRAWVEQTHDVTKLNRMLARLLAAPENAAAGPVHHLVT
jgi:colanic acid/amylovoran biosynthesis glycosyltransferase